MIAQKSPLQQQNKLIDENLIVQKYKFVVDNTETRMIRLI